MRISLISLLLFFSLFSYASFDEYFENKALRIDYYHTGNSVSDSYSIDEMLEEPYWGGSKVNLIDTFNYGKYKFVVIDEATQNIIYSHGYSTLFSEWQTTDEAKKTIKSFSETVLCPYPKKNIKVEFYSIDNNGKFIKKFEYFVNPQNYFISKEKKAVYPVFNLLKSGDPDKKIDIVILPEGYKKSEIKKFKNDCERFTKALFNASPFKEMKDKFNVNAVEVTSEESGTDIPGENIWKNTAINSSFYTFGTERYLMTAANKRVRDVASNVPYDQIYILVNTDKYGGGAIYNLYAISVTTNDLFDYIVVHEFGHAFAGLADEYYTSEVSYRDFYPKNIEPWEPNLTTLVDFGKKWKNMLDKDVPIPTPPDEKYCNKLGVFEGGGYEAKGVYRPACDCIMKSLKKEFCGVCKNAIIKMIEFYTK
ncbi:MAG: M64 family metallopeptidase [Bacteroidales bacterium]|jgi:hypothetical protein